jgi:hypothetical protein
MQIIANQGLRTLGPLWQGIRAGLRAAFSINYLRVFITGFRGIWTVARGLLFVLSKMRTVLFSLSGWLLIVEGLILFGDKIPVISDLLEKMGNAFKNLFSNIGDTLKNTVPSLGLLGKGINDIFGGKSERGVARIKDALLDLGEVIRTGLSAAWAKFLDDMQPITDRVTQFVKGLIDVFNLLITAVGSVFGTIGDTIGSQLGSGGSALDAAKAATSPENIASVFAVIGGAVVEIAKILMDILAAILSVTEVFNKGMGALIRWFSTTAVKDSQRNYWEAVASGFEMQGQMAGARVADLKGGRTSALEEAFNNYMESITPPKESTDSTPEKDAAAAAAAATGRNRAMMASIFDGTYMESGAGPAVKKLLGAMLSQPLIDPTKQQRDADGLLDFMWEEDAREETNKGLRKGIKNLLQTTPTDIKEGAAGLWDGFKKVFLPPDLDAAVAPQAAQLAPIAASIGKAIVGDFESTRGNLAQMVPKMERLQQQTVDELEEANVGLAALTNNKNPFVFNA